MAEEISELLVKVRPDGAQETREELERTEESFDETAGSVGESADMLGEFSRKFKGAGLVFAGAFATLIGAIVSKMPVVNETASALDAVLLSLGIRFSRLAREDVDPLNRKLFRLSGLLVSGKDDFGAIVLAVDIFNDAIDAIPFSDAIADSVPFIDKMETVESVLRGIWLFLENNDVLAGLETAFNQAKTVVDDIATDIESRVTNMVAGIIIDINDAIRAFNRIPGGPNAPFIDIPTPPQGDVPVVPETGGGEDMGVQGGGSTIATGTVETSIEVDGQQIATASKPYIVRGALSKGRYNGE